MRRRDFIVGLGAVAWPVAAKAQQRVRRIGVLMFNAEDDPEGQAWIKAFQQELQRLGWNEGGNVRIDYRWTSVDPERLQAYSAELVRMAPDVIVTSSNSHTTALSRQTQTIPIVFAGASGVFETGLIKNMAHPGGNVTGFVQFEREMAGKWLQLLKEVVPDLKRVAFLYSPLSAAGPFSAAALRLGHRPIDAAAQSLAIETLSVATQHAAVIAASLDTLSQQANSGIVVLSAPTNYLHADRIISLAARHRLPAIYPNRLFATSGGLLAYGSDIVDQYRRAASYVDRILRGEKPGDMPVQEPTKYELVINLKTAKALGLTVPQSILLRAIDVIE
jgi:putative tryptophan/tyrosine transport system substrate-binding protein